MIFDHRHKLLFVAGGPTGQAYIYNTRTRGTVASYQFGAPKSSFINDVTLTRHGAWFTDSMKAGSLFSCRSANTARRRKRSRRCS